MSYANGLQGVGIAIPNPDVNLHPLNIDLESIFNNGDSSLSAFVAPTTGSGLINAFTDTYGNTVPLVAPATSGLNKNWLYGGLAVAAFFIFGRK